MTDNLWCMETQVSIEDMGKENEKRYSLGDNAPYETCATSISELYHMCVKEHGRCTGKMYVDDGKQVGWVFLKKNAAFGLIETWVEVFTKPPVKRIVWDPPEYPTFQRVRPKSRPMRSSSKFISLGGSRPTRQRNPMHDGVDAMKGKS